MLAKESVKQRLETGLSFTEFSYQLLQAYDFYWLYENMDCKIQMGGSDQWGNITTGTELIRRKAQGSAYALTGPLVTNADGSKFGKSEGEDIWLDPKRTSPYRFYQYWLNADDRDVINYLKFFTWLDEKEIRELESAVKTKPEEREAQKCLAREMTRNTHDETALGKAEQASQVLFGGEIGGLSAVEVADIFADVPSGQVSGIHLQGEGLPILDLLMECRVLSSKAEARRAIEAGGIYVNNRRVADPLLQITSADAVENQFIVLRRGRKSYWLIRIAP